MSYLQRIRQSQKVTNEEVEAAIDSYIIKELHREILKKKLLKGMTFKELAAEYKYCERHIKRIVSEGEMIIFKKIEP